jgi:prephenate dehydratase/chorismate mutase/prephenate dehydratase
MNLEDLRKDIDGLDARILALLNERMEKAILTRRFKEGIVDSSREAAVLDKVRRQSRCLIDPEFAAGLYESVLAQSKALQAKGLRTIGFQGEHGAYSEMAARSWAPDAAAIPCREFVDVFDAVEEGLFDFGIVPVENTLGGLVGPVNSILVYTGLRIVAAVDMGISHCLLAPPGTDHREIRSVLSHSQALAQCRRFLARNKLDPEPFYDTAGAAREVAQSRPKGVAAIASRFSADLYDLEILKEGIQDSENNRTRFFVLARDAASGGGAEPDGSKGSAVFSAEGDKAGALYGVLEIFARRGINLTRIESVPDKPGDYAIFIDFEGSRREARVLEALSEAEKTAREFRVLGFYDETRL